MDNIEKTYNNMKNKYSVAKTLRFELIPQYQTLEHISKDKIVETDEKRIDEVKFIKKLSDEVYKLIINKQLENYSFNLNDLMEYHDYYMAKDVKKLDEKIKNIEDDLEKQIKSEEYKKMISKDFIQGITSFVSFDFNRTKEIYLSLYEDQKNSCTDEGIYNNIIKIIKKYKNFTTFFVDFMNNRKNIFNRSAKETSVPYRIVEDNLPIYINNIHNLKNIIEKDQKFLEDFNSEIDKEIASIIKEMKLENYSNFITQEDIDRYNLAISGKNENYNDKKIKGINEFINEYNQKNKTKFPRLSKLKKQILSDSVTNSFVFEFIEDDNDLFSQVIQFINVFNEMLEDSERNIFKLFSNIKEMDLNTIYIENAKIKDLSNYIFKNYNYIQEKLIEEMDKEKLKKKEKEKILKDDLTLQQILNILNIDDQKAFLNMIEKSNYLYSVNKNKDISYKELLENLNDRSNKFISTVKNTYLDKRDVTDTSKLKKELKEELKAILDEYKSMHMYFRMFEQREQNYKIDSIFYPMLDDSYTILKYGDSLYNKVRNYLTKKPYSNEKFKLTFNNPQFLAGWSKSKEASCFGFFMKKGEEFFVGFINPNLKKKTGILEEDEIKETINKKEIKTSGETFTKYDLYYLADSLKALPKKFFANKWKDVFNPSEEMKKAYNISDFKNLEEKERIKKEREVIKFYIDSINKVDEWAKYDFKFKNYDEYSGLREFFKDVDRQTYKFELREIPVEYIEYLVNNNSIYLFKLYNKDFSKYSKGKPNLHTMYFKAIFDERNFDEYQYKISGSAEVFYRRASLDIEETVIHKKGDKLENKNPLNPKTNIFDYDIIKDRRYTNDKFFLHVPIEMNRVSENSYEINKEINEIVKQREKNYILGIDRGERNLIYLCLIDEKGKIIFQKSLNRIVNEYKEKSTNDVKKVEVDYKALLGKKEEERKQARLNWDNIENIKELKEGYLSNVVKEIVDIVLEYNPIIIIENLNSGFINSRKKREVQVYQKFVNNLIRKFNYLITKDVEDTKPGGLFNPLQLTPEFSNPKYIGKQAGIIYQIPAAYTSNIDPTTGYFPFLQCKYKNIETSKEFFNKFDDIYYDENMDMFVFVANYKKFRPDADYWNKEVWKIYSNGERIDSFKNKDKNYNWDDKKVVLVDEFKQLFDKYEINYKTDLKEQIINKDDKEFFESLIYLVRLTQKLRNSITNDVYDKIISPVLNNKNKFFESDISDETNPIDADANGAYNIARKGLLVIRNIKNDIDIKKICDIKNADYYKFLEELNNNE